MIQVTPRTYIMRLLKAWALWGIVGIFVLGWVGTRDSGHVEILPGSTVVVSATGTYAPAFGAYSALTVQVKSLRVVDYVAAWVVHRHIVPAVAGVDPTKQYQDALKNEVLAASLVVGRAAPPASLSDPSVVGPSAGLAMALTSVDAAGAGDLTGGHAVAATGEITSTGHVLAVGDVDLKIKEARQNDAKVVFVPAGQVPQQLPAGITVVPVSSLTAAVHWLCANGAKDAVCT